MVKRRGDLLGKSSKNTNPQVKSKKTPEKQIQEYEIVHLIWLWLKNRLALVFQASLLGGQSFWQWLSVFWNKKIQQKLHEKNCCSTNPLKKKSWLPAPYIVNICFLVPLIGGRWYIIIQLAVDATYIWMRWHKSPSKARLTNRIVHQLRKSYYRQETATPKWFHTSISMAQRLWTYHYWSFPDQFFWCVPSPVLP